jgi:polysaccharide export outer membrane protein
MISRRMTPATSQCHTALRAIRSAGVLFTAAVLVAPSCQGQTGGTGASNTTPATIQASAPASTNGLNQSMLYPGEDFKLHAGDLISVRVFGSADYNLTVRIGLDGTARLAYIGLVPLIDLSVRQAQDLIADRLREGQFYRDPDVILQVLDTVNGSVYVTGEVKATVPVATERSLRDVLLTAGGLPPNASHTVKIVRPGVEHPIVVDLGTDLASSTTANVPVYPHDIIQITRASQIYILGAFRTQGAVPLDQSSPLTLMQAAALSGGVNYEGKYEDLRLIRTVGTERKVVDVDVKKVLYGKAPDPVLQANDIVFLPTNNTKAVLKSLGVGGIIGVVSLLIALRNY